MEKSSENSTFKTKNVEGTVCLIPFSSSLLLPVYFKVFLPFYLIEFIQNGSRMTLSSGSAEGKFVCACVRFCFFFLRGLPGF